LSDVALMALAALKIDDGGSSSDGGSHSRENISPTNVMDVPGDKSRNTTGKGARAEMLFDSTWEDPRGSGTAVVADMGGPLQPIPDKQSNQGHLEDTEALIDEAHHDSLPGLEWHCNNAKPVTSAEISDHTLNDSVDHHKERGTIAEAGTNDNYTTREDVERSCLRPNNENERNQSLRDKLTHRRKLLAFVRQSRVAAEERIRNILHEESDTSSLIIPRDEVVGVESSTLLDEADPGSNDGTYSTQVHANEPDLESHTRLTWDDGLEQIKAFKVKFGHVDIPTTYTDQQNQPLRFFVRNIRKSYKNIQEGQTSENKQLSDKRISELERMGFRFQVRVRTSWEHRFEELRQHFRTHGNSEDPKNSELRGWVHQQRYHFRMVLKGATKRLTEKRIGILNSIGFDWRVVMKVQVPDQVSVNADQGR
jgi:hypothetical protein